MGFPVADIDAMLLAAGEPITFGSTTVNGVVRAVDEEELKDEATRKMWGTPVTVVARASEVLIRADTLPGVKPGSLVTFGGIQYTVDHVFRASDDDFQRIRAYQAA